MVGTIEDFKSLVSAKGGLAQSNLLQVILPDGSQFPGSNTSVNELDILCSSVSLPGRQVQTVDRLIGPVSEKVATGSVTDDVSFTFKVLNDYGIKQYFDNWQKIAYNPDTREIGYKSDYRKQVIINQLKKGVGSQIIYECKLLEAWPVNMDTVTLNNDLDGLVEITVQLAYTRWSSRYFN